MHSVKYKSERKSGNSNCKITTQKMKNFYVCNLWCLVKKKKRREKLTITVNKLLQGLEGTRLSRLVWLLLLVLLQHPVHVRFLNFGQSPGTEHTHTHTRHSTLIVIYIYIYAVFMYKEQDDNPEEIWFFFLFWLQTPLMFRQTEGSVTSQAWGGQSL